LEARVGDLERAAVLAPRDESGWCARYRIGAEPAWSECRLLDISLDGAVVELAGDLADGLSAELPFFLQIDSIADDQVGVTMPAAIRSLERGASGGPTAEIEFSARREERMLLHLLVRLRALV
jgi:hypothetical protein